MVLFINLKGCQKYPESIRNNYHLNHSKSIFKLWLRIFSQCKTFSNAKIRKECKDGHRTPKNSTVWSFEFVVQIQPTEINAPAAEKQAQRKASRLSNSSVKLRRSCSSKHCWWNGPIWTQNVHQVCVALSVSEMFIVFHRLFKKTDSYCRRQLQVTATESNMNLHESTNGGSCGKDRHANGLKHPAGAPRSLALRPSRRWNEPMKPPVVGHCQASGRQWAERWAFSSGSGGQEVTCAVGIVDIQHLQGGLSMSDDVWLCLSDFLQFLLIWCEYGETT